MFKWWVAALGGWGHALRAGEPDPGLAPRRGCLRQPVGCDTRPYGDLPRRQRDRRHDRLRGDAGDRRLYRAPDRGGRDRPARRSRGAIEEARVSDSVRYSGAYTVPSAAFAPDASTRALWHFDHPALHEDLRRRLGQRQRADRAERRPHTRTRTRPPASPGAPTNVIGGPPATARRRSSGIPPSSDGGSPVTGYIVTPYVGATASGADDFGQTSPRPRSAG